MSVALQKIDGVESVDVSLNEGFAHLRLRKGNRVTLARLRELIRKNGFTPAAATVTAEGTLTGRDGARALELGGGETLPLSGDLARLPAGAGRRVSVTGVLPEKGPETLAVTSAAPAGGE